MKTGLVAGLLVLAVIGAGCGSSDDDESGSDQELTATWLYTGPIEDGGYNESMTTGMEAMDSVAGVTVNSIDDLPYTQRTSQVIRQSIAQGSNVIVDTLGLSTLLTDPCQEAPEVKCFGAADPAPQPENSRAFWPEEWNLGFVGGQAAGLMTKTDTVGFIGPSEIPISVAGLNTFALGCQSVNPECEVKAIFINTFFDPPKAAQAAETLIDSGADVLRNDVDDPSFCQVAEQRGAYAVGLWNDFSAACPDSIITSTIWDLTDYFTEQTETIKNDEFESSGKNPDFIPVGEGDGEPHIGTWGDFVPDDVREQVEATYAEILEGKDVIVGPISDNTGKLQFKKGEVPDNMFLMSGWDWFVEGVESGN